MRSRLVFILPIAGFAVLAFFLFKGLWGRPADQIPSVLINKPAPLDQVPALDAQTQGFGPKELKSGKVVVVNFFSSTCVPCRLEAPVLNQLAQTPGITLYGYVWKDKIKNAFMLDTTKRGNGNSGHEFSNEKRTGVIGPELKEDERRALIEFIKTL